MANLNKFTKKLYLLTPSDNLINSDDLPDNPTAFEKNLLAFKKNTEKL